VSIAPIGDTRIEIGHVHYRGEVTVSGHEDGLAVVEATDVDTYLEGIAEVPFAWHPQALRAQAVAARTYLAWTLSRGRSASGRAYDYDICATTACQVYSGVDLAEGSFGAPWRAAVSDTRHEVLMAEGSPAQALYSSTSSGRTRNVEDVFPGASPTFYLRAVDSPNEDSPFVEWKFEITEDEMATLLDDAGLLEGELLGISTLVTGDGEGSWTVVIEGSEGRRRIGTWELRTALNAAAAAVLPDRFPVMRPDVDRRYPQTILSPSFTVETIVRYRPPTGTVPMVRRSYLVRGGGWGHLVGMSQFGAAALADRGMGYTDILAHYYGGLTPVEAPDALPDVVRVGLATELDELDVSSDGPVRVTVDDQVVEQVGLGGWSFEAVDGLLRARPPAGLGLEPSITGVRVVAGFFARPSALAARLASAAEVRVSVFERGAWVPKTDWVVVEAGPVRWHWVSLVPPSRPTAIVRIDSRSPDGADTAIVAWISGAE
jgi:stage II sporulation protein D